MQAMHLRDLELAQLRLLEAIAETRSLSAAARAVGLSPSAASHSLARLRLLAQDPLFVRTSNGMQPTPFGAQVCSAIRSAVATLREGLESVREFDPASSSRTFRLYMSEVGQLVLIPSLLAHLRVHAPGVRLHVSRVPAESPGGALESGDIDLAIGHLKTLTTGFHQRLLFHERYVCVASLDNPLFASGMSREAFQAAKHAIADSSGMAHWVVDHELEQQGIGRDIGLVVPEFMTLPFVIPGSTLVAILPSRLADQFARVVALRVMPLPIAMDSYEILAFWHERAHHDPAVRWLRQMFAELFRALDQAGTARL
jgi:DNA-binding transcriptional LysR family regulator